MCLHVILEQTMFVKVKIIDSVSPFTFHFEGYHNRLNSRIYRNHPNIWNFITFLQAEEKRVQCITIQWAAGAARKQNTRTTSIQHRINNLYQRFAQNLINLDKLLTGLSYVVAKNSN